MLDKNLYEDLWQMMTDEVIVFKRVHRDGTYTEPSNEALLSLMIVGLERYSHSDLTFKEALSGCEYYEVNSIEEYNEIHGEEYKSIKELKDFWGYVYLVYGTERFIIVNH